MHSEININLAYLKFKQGSEATTKSKYHTCKHNTSDLKKQHINSTFLITQEEKRLLITSVDTRLAINPFNRVMLVNKYIHAFPSFWSVLCTPAGTPHSRHCPGNGKLWKQLSVHSAFHAFKHYLQYHFAPHVQICCRTPFFCGQVDVSADDNIFSFDLQPQPYFFYMTSHDRSSPPPYQSKCIT